MASSHLDSPLTSLPLRVQREAEIYLLDSCIRTRQKMDGALLSGGPLLGWAPRVPKKYLTQRKIEAWAWVALPTHYILSNGLGFFLSAVLVPLSMARSAAKFRGTKRV